MAYLRDKDYDKQIQGDNLNQIISNDNSIKTACALIAQSELISYLTQKYLVSSEFTDTVVWNYSTSYKASNRVYIDATAYSASGTYAINSLTLQAGNVYICTTAITMAEAFTIGHWALLGLQYDLFFVSYPQPLFQIGNTFNIGDKVFWKDKIYTCVIPSLIQDQETILQYSQYSDIPQRNVFPDDQVNGLQYWGAGVPYSVVAGTLPANATYWTAGDNRNQQLVMYMIDIALFHMHSRIAPRNIPQLRKDRYDSAKQWLILAATGEITADIPLIQPKTGSRIRYGGNTKNINIY